MAHDQPEPLVPLEEVEARMRPGRFSQAGFLGPHERLREVLETDARALADLGVSARALAERLGGILERAVRSKSRSSRVERYEVSVRRYKGSQICPFAPQAHENPCPAGGGSARFASIDWNIRNTQTRVRVSGPGLIVHLIGAHGFFEGVQSPYRIAPRALAELLELGVFASRAPDR